MDLDSRVTILQSFCHPVNRRNNTWLNSIWQIYEELLVVELIGQGLIFHINLLSAGIARLGGDLETNELPNPYYLCLEISFQQSFNLCSIAPFNLYSRNNLNVF